MVRATPGGGRVGAACAEANAPAKPAKNEGFKDPRLPAELSLGVNMLLPEEDVDSADAWAMRQMKVGAHRRHGGLPQPDEVEEQPTPPPPAANGKVPNIASAAAQADTGRYARKEGDAKKP